MPHPTMQIFARTRAAAADREARGTTLRIGVASHRAYRARLVALRSRAPDAERARIVRELRAAARQTPQR
jgi:hypothetical protein